jgi:hypothetical protein
MKDVAEGLITIRDTARKLKNFAGWDAQHQEELERMDTTACALLTRLFQLGVEQADPQVLKTISTKEAGGLLEAFAILGGK